MVARKEELRCTKNCGAGYPQFCGTARVSENWIVDAGGNWEETTGTEEVISDPDRFTCANCGADAEWRDVPDKPRAVPASQMKVWLVLLGDEETYDVASTCTLVEVPENKLPDIQNNPKLLRDPESQGWRTKPLEESL